MHEANVDPPDALKPCSQYNGREGSNRSVAGGRMDSVLLATKLRVPPQPQHAVRRPRLVDMLERGIPNYKLCVISAAAGYGKTTLLAQWAHTTHLPIVWLSIGEEDRDLDRFLRYLFAGWEMVQPGLQQSSLGLLLGSASPDTETVLSAFINAAHDAPDHLVFVLDEFHLVQEPAIHQSVIFLIDHLPPHVHFLFSGRAEPPFPLARYRGRNELLEVGETDLRFVDEETAEFLQQQMQLELAQEEVLKLQIQLEGWITGLQLVALTLQRRPVSADTLAISGRHPFIADYLSQEVLAQLPEDTRQFMLQTSILDRLSAPLCDTVTQLGGGQEMLELLERENLFLVPLDNRREWFRYHRLFADFLYEALQRDDADKVADLHRRAAQWYLTHDLPEPAFQHAVAGLDVELVIQIAEHYFLMKLFGGEISVVQRWLDSLPEAWHSSRPVFHFIQAVIFFFTGQSDAAIRCLDNVERMTLAESEGTRWPIARVTALRCFVACFHKDLELAEALAHQALRELPESDQDLRHGIYGSLGDTYRQYGRWEAAKEHYLKALDFAHTPTSRIQSVDAFGALADLELHQGRLRESASYWRKALAVIQERATWGSFPLPVIGWIFMRLGEILYEWNDLPQARDYLSQGLERAELGGDVRAVIAGRLLTGRLKLTEGDSDVAAEYLERARPLLQQSSFQEWGSRFDRLQADLWLSQGRIKTAAQWADTMLQAVPIEVHLPATMTPLMLARVLIAKADTASLERALILAADLVQAAADDGRMGVEIEALALLAIIHWKRGQRVEAMTALERALRLGEPEGYVRLFTDIGLPIVRLLQEARSRGVMPDYVDKLLAASGSAASIPMVTNSPLPEPLTPREEQILKLIAAGLTNLEIAEKLVISPLTVKKHTGSIYSKFGVHSRMQAVARARALDLLT